ncbi:MAG: hypothetical protein ACM3Q2_18385, partial [Syntrophothermus sp.]
NIYSYPFQFVTYGFIGSVVFAALKYLTLRDSLFLMAACFVANILLYNHTVLVPFIIMDTIILSGLYVSIWYYYTRWYHQLSEAFYFRPLALTAIYGIFYPAFGIVLLLIYTFVFGKHYDNFFNILFTDAKMGTLIGMGLGIGFEMAGVAIRRMGRLEPAGNIHVND